MVMSSDRAARRVDVHLGALVQTILSTNVDPYIQSLFENMITAFSWLFYTIPT